MEQGHKCICRSIIHILTYRLPKPLLKLCRNEQLAYSLMEPCVGTHIYSPEDICREPCLRTLTEHDVHEHFLKLFIPPVKLRLYPIFRYYSISIAAAIPVITQYILRQFLLVERYYVASVYPHGVIFIHDPEISVKKCPVPLRTHGSSVIILACLPLDYAVYRSVEILQQMIRHPSRQMLQLLLEKLRRNVLFILQKCLKPLADHRLCYIPIVFLNLIKKLLRIRTVALSEFAGFRIECLSHFICNLLLLLKLKSCLLVFCHCNPFLYILYVTDTSNPVRVLPHPACQHCEADKCDFITLVKLFFPVKLC